MRTVNDKALSRDGLTQQLVEEKEGLRGRKEGRKGVRQGDLGRVQTGVSGTTFWLVEGWAIVLEAQRVTSPSQTLLRGSSQVPDLRGGEREDQG